MKSCHRVQSAVTSSRKQRHDLNSDDFLKSLKCSWAPDFKPQVKQIHLESLQIRWFVYLQIQSEYITGPISYFLVDQSGRWGQSLISPRLFSNALPDHRENKVCPIAFTFIVNPFFITIFKLIPHTKCLFWADSKMGMKSSHFFFYCS